MSPAVYMAGIFYLSAVLWRVHGFKGQSWVCAGCSVALLISELVL